MTDNLVITNANRGVYLGNKSARGTITNNIIIGNGTGISGFARSNVKVENNIIADSSYAGIGMRDSCSLTIRDNIFQGNQRGLILIEEGSRNGNTVGINTFWRNKVDTENMDKAAGSINADPGFVDAENGDFSLKPGPVLQQKQGLTNPEIFKVLWKRWQNRADKNEPFTGGATIPKSEKSR
jgi:parallel beta-helix repeat protein